MKIVYQNVVWLLSFVAYNYLCFANKQNAITVGAFFSEENSQARLAFESAIYTTNLMQDNVHYNPHVEVIPKMDSFQCSKILCNLTQHYGMAGIFGPPSLTTTPIVQSICANLEIPHIQINWRPSAPFSERDTFLNFHPDPELLFQGLAVIVKSLQWRSFVVLYESNEGLIRLQDVLKIQNYNKDNKYNTILVKQLGPGPDHRPLLKEIHNSTETHIILDCAIENTIDVLKQAKEVKLLESVNSYFLTNLDAHTLDFSVLDTAANITTIRIINPGDPNFERALQNWQQYADVHYPELNINLKPFSIKTETALMHDAVQMFIRGVNELHLTGAIEPQKLGCHSGHRWRDGLRISSYLKAKIDPSGITGPVKFDPVGRRINFTVYLVEDNTVIAEWHANNPESINHLRSENDTLSASIKSLQKGVVIVSSRLGPPYLMERKPRYEGEIITGNDRYEGFSMDLIKAIADVLGFKFEFKLAKDGKYGNYDPKKKEWNGLIKDLLDGKAHLAICDLTITHQRREVVDFSMPFMRLGISILYKKAEMKDINMFAFLDPFSIEVWIYTATLYLAISVIIYFVARMAPGDWENPHPCDENPEELENIWDLKNCLWLTLGSIMTQGCDILPKGISSRMIASMWWFFSLIMTSSYTANLAAFLTTDKLESSIGSAEDLAKQTKIKYGTVEGGATQAFFKESNYSTFQRMWTNMAQSKPSVFEKNNGDGVRRVQTTKNRMYAFLMESSQIEYEIETKCDLKQIGGWLDSKGYGIAMPIDYPYRSAINTAILKLQEETKLTQLKNKWWKKMRTEPSCPKGSSEEKSAELALANVGGVFLVLAIGVSIAFCISVLEFLWNVRNVSVEEHLTYLEALKVELIFALNVWITKKKTKPKISESSSSHSGGDAKSIAQSILHGAGSFLHLNMLNKIGTPSRDE